MIIQDILIPLDGSGHARVAVSYGIYLAEKLKANLTGLHVIDLRLLHGPVFTDVSGSGIPSYEEFIPAIENSLNASAETIIEEFRKQCAARGISPQTKKITGIIDDVIIAEGQGRCDWILLAQRGEHFHIDDGALLGSTTQSVVRRSGKPVFVTPGKYREIHSMAIAYDGSAPARKALNLAAELAKLTEWPLTVIIIANDHKWGEETAHKAADYLSPFAIQKKITLLKGNEELELLKFTGEGTADLLVMGAYGHNMLRELVLGSITSLIIRKSEIPVLLTR
ncbi:MAG: universal stress protein [Syntrophobacterales bacterium]|nr:universal stress protein [Syntrophobacterales bacterium]